MLRTICFSFVCVFLTLLHSERPKLHRVLAVLNATGLKQMYQLLFGTSCFEIL